MLSVCTRPSRTNTSLILQSFKIICWGRELFCAVIIRQLFVNLNVLRVCSSETGRPPSRRKRPTLLRPGRGKRVFSQGRLRVLQFHDGDQPLPRFFNTSTHVSRTIRPTYGPLRSPHCIRTQLHAPHTAKHPGSSTPVGDARGCVDERGAAGVFRAAHVDDVHRALRRRRSSTIDGRASKA